MNYDVIIDSYAWIEYFRGSKEGEIVKNHLEKSRCATPTIVIAELSDKYARDGYKTIETDMNFILSRTAIIELTKDIALIAGKTKNICRRNNPAFGLADAIIYETAKSCNASLLTGDLHFKGFDKVIFLGE
jgi:predicted nucleic acid-binding protein